MSTVPVSILLVEDNPGDVLLLREALGETGMGQFRLAHVERLSECLKILAAGQTDVVLLDLTLPDAQGLRTLMRVRAEAPDVPIVVLTGFDDEEFSLKAVREGAEDYLVKGRINGHLLARSLRYAIERHRLTSEHKRVEKALRKSEASLREAQRVGRVGSWEVDMRRGSLEWSEETYRIFGREPGRFTPTIEVFYAAVHPDDRERVMQISRAAQRNGKLYSIDHRIRLLDGTERMVHEQAEIIRDEQGQPVRMIGTVQDITDRATLEAQLRQSQKMESIGHLAGGVAHDFNNILTIIQGHASLLLMNEHMAAKAADSAQQIAQASERAANLTRQLLTFSRKQVMQPKNLDLNEVAGNMTKMLHRLLGEDVRLQIESTANLPLVHADAGMMEQIMLNLAVNARDAMPKGGRLIIHTSAEKIDEEFARQHAGSTPGQFVRLTVTDTGGGIPPENLTRIFEPFFTTKEVGKGTGLGLATVYGIVEQHHGWIKVYSEVGHGTAFHVYFPACGGPRRNGDTDFLQRPVQGGTETVLLVEDESALRQLARIVLERYGYTVFEAPHGVAALEMWSQYEAQIQLLITDMVMPGGVNGVELAGQLQALKPTLKVIYTSGYSAEVLSPGLLSHTEVTFLQKPYQPSKLAQTVRDCLDGKSKPS